MKTETLQIQILWKSVSYNNVQLQKRDKNLFKRLLKWKLLKPPTEQRHRDSWIRLWYGWDKWKYFMLFFSNNLNISSLHPSNSTQLFISQSSIVTEDLQIKCRKLGIHYEPGPTNEPNASKNHRKKKYLNQLKMAIKSWWYSSSTPLAWKSPFQFCHVCKTLFWTQRNGIQIQFV